MELQTTKNLYDLAQLRGMTGENEEFLIMLAGIYLTTIPFNTAEMVQAAGSGDWLTVSKLAHKIKPTIDSMNISSIKADIRTLESDGKDKINTDRLKEIAVKVDKVVNAVAEQLKDEYNL